MYHRDWLMRQIETVSRFVFATLLNKEPSSEIRLEPREQTDGDVEPLGFRLAALVREEQLCEAENLLWAAVEDDDPEALRAGLRFYTDLNALPDETLERCSFPRDEILSGLKELCAAYGCDLSVLGE